MTPPPDPLAGFKGPTSKERKKVGRRKRKKWREKGREKGREWMDEKGLTHCLCYSTTLARLCVAFLLNCLTVYSINSEL